MSYAIYSPEESILCPHCDAIQDDKAEDFVIIGRETEWSQHECYDCWSMFGVRLNEEKNVYEVAV